MKFCHVNVFAIGNLGFISAILVFVATQSTLSQTGLSSPGRAADSPQMSARRMALEYFTLATDLEQRDSIEQAYVMYDSALIFDSDAYDIRLGLGRTAMKLGRRIEALHWIQPLKPRDATTYRLLLELFRSGNQTDSTVACVKELVRLDSSEVNGRFFLANYYERGGKLDSALIYLLQGAQLTQDYRAWRQIGGFELHLERPEQALLSFRRSVSLEGSALNLGAYGGIIDALEATKRVDEVRPVLDTMLMLDSTYVPAYRRFVDYFVSRNEYDSALRYARAVVRLSPQDTPAIEQLGVIAFQADSLELAKEQFNLLLSISDLRVTNYYYLARIYFAEENFPYALMNFRKVTTLVDSVADGWLGAGLCYHAMDSLSAEVNTYTEALLHVRELHQRVALLFAQGATLERLKRYDESERAFNDAISLDSTHAPSLNYLGYMLVDRNERLPHGKALITRALKLSPENGAYLDSYGWALFREGDYAGALDTLRRAAKVVNLDPTVFEHLGDTFDQLHNIDSARVYWQKALDSDSTNAALREKLTRAPQR